MGGEFAQFREWDYKGSLDWNLFGYSKHKGVFEMVKKANAVYENEKSFHKDDQENFRWINYKDKERSVLSFIRKDKDDFLVVVCNFANAEFKDYIIGVPRPGEYKEIFSSDEKVFGGEGRLNGVLKAKREKFFEFEYSLSLDLAPLSAVYLKIKL